MRPSADRRLPSPKIEPCNVREDGPLHESCTVTLTGGSLGPSLDAHPTAFVPHA